MLKIGLTGNIASGKSTTEKILENLGYKVVDLDKVSHFLLENDCAKAILNEFNTIERKKLADIVFKDKEKLKKLENIIHPEIKKYIQNFFLENKNEQLVFVSGALIFEAGFNNLFDKIIFVDAPVDLRLKRLMKRNNLDKKAAILRISAQTENYKNKADIIIQNDKTESELVNQVKYAIKLLN